jgi:hypothetical protein
MNQGHVVDRHAGQLKPERSHGADAFLPELAQISGAIDTLAALLGEEYLRKANGADSEESAHDDMVAEKLEGPFVESGPEEEYGATKKGQEYSYAVDDETRWFVSGPTQTPIPQAVGLATQSEVSIYKGKGDSCIRRRTTFTRRIASSWWTC